MIKIFDLDDTLYPEYTFVEGGFRSVAAYMEDLQGFDSKETFADLLEILCAHGRGEIFDIYLKRKRVYSFRLVRKLVAIYRYHEASLNLHDDAYEYLNSAKNESLYLVTDGNKLVQQNKIQALGLCTLFKKVYITHRYGLKHSKPSPYCFDLIRRNEGCSWHDMVYFGDNPKKDFVELNKLGATTVRLLRGNHRFDVAKPGFDAHYAVKSFNDVLPL